MDELDINNPSHIMIRKQNGSTIIMRPNSTKTQKNPSH